MSPIALRAIGLTKVYGATVALEGADLEVRGGEIHGLLGENGAGKSTLVRLLAGVDRADAGTIEVDGKQLPRHHTPRDSRAAGMSFIHQNLALVESMTVAENFGLVRGFPRRHRLIDRRVLGTATREALLNLGVDLGTEQIVEQLPIAHKALLAIARALTDECRLLVLDEPTASLPAHEAKILFNALDRLRGTGVACLLISHRTAEILETCDAVTVLRDGCVVARRSAVGLTRRALAELIVGHAPQTFGRSDIAHSVERVPPRLVARDLKVPGAGPVSLAVAPGEIVGITGLADAGHGLIGEALFGLHRLEGHVLIEGRPCALTSPSEARRRGISYVPADRDADGLVPTLRNFENVFLETFQRWIRLLPTRSEREQTGEVLRRFAVRPPDPNREPSTLSGGNAQKVLLAKWVRETPRVLVLAEPTTGVDVGAKADIWCEIAAAARQGTAVVLVSSDLEEVAAVSDRILVMRAGRPAGWLDGGSSIADLYALAQRDGPESSATTHDRIAAS